MKNLNSVLIEGFIKKVLHSDDKGQEILLCSNSNNINFQCDVIIHIENKILNNIKPDLSKYNQVRVFGRLKGDEELLYVIAEHIEFHPVI